MQAAEEGGAGKDGDGDASAEPKLGLSGTGTIFPCGCCSSFGDLMTQT